MKKIRSIWQPTIMSFFFALLITVITPSLAAPKLVINDGHDGIVTSAVFSPNGKLLLSGSQDGTVRIWDASSGRELRQIKLAPGSVWSVAFSPDGSTILSGGQKNSLQLFNAASGKVLRKFVGHKNTVKSVAFSPDGHSLLSGSYDKTIRLWNTDNGKLIRTFRGHSDWVGPVAYSPDGQTLLSGGKDMTLRLWNASNGRELRRIEGHTGTVVALAFSPDGRSILSGSEDKTLRLWDAATGQEKLIIKGHQDSIFATAFSPDGGTLLSGSADGTLKKWDVSNGKELLVMRGSEGMVRSAVFSPDGNSILSGDESSMRLWNADSGKELRRMGVYAKPIMSAIFSPDGQKILSGGQDHTLHLWDIGTGGNLRRFSGHSGWVWSVAFSPDGQEILSGSFDDTVRLWNVANGVTTRKFESDTKAMSSVAFSPDGYTLLAGGTDRSLYLWDVRSGKELHRMEGHKGTVTSVAFSPNGRTLLSGSGDTSICLWNRSNGKKQRCMKGHTSAIFSVAFSPDGLKIVSGSEDQTMRLWDVASGSELRRFNWGGGWVVSVAFSPDGRTLLSGSGDKIIRLWDASSGEELRRYVGHNSLVTTVAFSPDGLTLLSAAGSGDNTMRLWNVSTGKELAQLISFIDGTWVVTDPEGRFDTADLESMPHLHWVIPDDPFTPVPLEAFMKDYYEPRLLARILAGEKFKPVRPLTTLNRTQPEVQITSIYPDDIDPSIVRVTVSAKGATKSYLQGEKEAPRTTAVHDLRLFRDGQVVAYADGKLADYKGSAFSKTFTVRLPAAKAGKAVVFSAYAFNDDRVKSETVRNTYKAPSSIVAKKGKAYVISMGVNNHDNPAWNLNYAVNDARLVSRTVSEKLAKSTQHQEVVAITLISDGTDKQASKAAMKAILHRMSGKPLDAAATALLQTIKGADKLQKATPDDLVLLSFSGHGFADDSGNFYLIPQDTGSGTGKNVTAELRQHSISSEELSQWLRDVDAGDMSMIVDACQSAASVQGNDFKPGPMGSRGLGQLAFDKGMRILAASQSDEEALEDGRIQQGLLSYALVRDGLNNQKADYKPADKKITLDEWLNYGVSRVPSLADDVKAGKLTAVKSAIPVSADGKQKKASNQQPALFDFAKGRKEVVLDVGLK